MRGGYSLAKSNQIILDVTGMTCAACSSRVERVLNRQEGVEAQVNLTTEKANVHYDPEITDAEKIISTIENIGYGVLDKKIEFDVFGMTCDACSSRIEKVLNGQKGINRAAVNLTNETATIEYQPALID